jgi:hypothetical protein
MKTRAENEWKSGPQKRAKMTCKKLKKAALDVFSEKSTYAAMVGKTFGCQNGFL